MLQFTKLMHKSLIAMVACVALAYPAFSVADNDSSEKPSFAPKIPHPTNGSKECVRPEDEMKKNHMKYILHQRDETMRKGIRTDTFALHECINCHIEKDSKVRFGNPEHFCSSCHSYAGVTIDCFQCHNDRPSDEDHEHTLLNSLSKPNYADSSAPISATGASHE